MARLVRVPSSDESMIDLVDLTGSPDSEPPSSSATPISVGTSTSSEQQQVVAQAAVPASAQKSAASAQAASPPPTAVVTNPYKTKKKKKFIGGAEAARKAAAKKSRATRILRPEERQRLDQVLPLRMNTFERFFAALLRSHPKDFCQSATTASDTSLWTTVCRRVGLTVPTAPLLATYDNPETHFSVRAALVLEEARHAIATPLADRYPLHSQQQQSYRQTSNQMICTLQLVEPGPANSPHCRLTFLKTRPFTKEELFHLRPGTILEGRPRDAPRGLSSVALGVVLSGSRESMEKSKTFRCQFFCELPSGEEWVLAPLASIIGEFRCFEAMVDSPCHKVGFLHALVGGKSATHVRFDQQHEKPQKQKSPPAAAPSITDFFAPRKAPEKKALPFRLPTLNPTQQKAAKTFLDSNPHTITLVQGPPGTGKTTLLVSIICQYLLKYNTEEDHSRRILVCAPTNKAISVLASRFVASIQPDHHVNALMVGDADKLLTDERSGSKGNSSTAAANNSPLRTIFVYSWMQVLTEDYRKLRNFFLPGARRTMTERQVYETAAQLERRLVQSLPHLAQEVAQRASAITETLGDWQSSASPAHGIVEQIESLLKDFKGLHSDFIRTELVNSAQVIFCTLSSSGGMILRGKLPVDDLIVDEAAAATEPELCIPFSLRPKRLLAVGDPLQLPATVLSRRAVDLGLTKSLHERLMYECNHPHVMLDVQYRMHPAISHFASRTFYDSKIANGPNVLPGGAAPYQLDSAATAPAGAHVGARLLNRQPYLFLQVAGMEEQGPGGSRRNPAEARAVVELVQAAAAKSRNDPSWSSADRIRIITFYQAQVVLLKNMLRAKGLEKVVVATVDSSQGCEADLVLVSFVRSSHQAGFLADNRRMNVALTRAKYQMIGVGNCHYFQGLVAAPTLQALAADAQERKVLVLQNSTAPPLTQATNKKHHPRGGPPQKRIKLDYS